MLQHACFSALMAAGESRAVVLMKWFAGRVYVERSLPPSCLMVAWQLSHIRVCTASRPAQPHCC